MVARPRDVRWRRIVAAGLVAVAIVLVAGAAAELWRFGTTDAAAADRIEARVREHFAEMSAALSDVASGVAASPTAAAGLTAGEGGVRALFDLLRDVRRERTADQAVAVTIYDIAGEARAWAGRASGLPHDRIAGPPAFFVTPATLGLRLVYLQPVLAADGARLGAVVAEQIVSPTSGPGMTPREFVLADPIAPVSLRPRYESGGETAGGGAFLLRSPAGEALAEGSTSRDAIKNARREWRAMIGGAALAVAALMLLLLIGPLLDRRVVSHDSRTFLRDTLLASLLLLAGTGGLWLSFVAASGVPPPLPGGMMLAGVAAASLAALWAAGVARRRLTFGPGRRAATDAPVRFILTQLAAGVAVAFLLVEVNQFFAWIALSSSIDLRHFSLHPWDTARIALFGGILAVHAFVLWTATLVLTGAPARWRLERDGWRGATLLLSCWLFAPTVAAILAFLGRIAVPPIGVLASALACAMAGLAGRRIVTWYRHATAVGRILALFVAFLAPALLLYPAVHFLAERAIRNLITTGYAPQAETHVQRLQDLTKTARDEIDRDPRLVEFVSVVMQPCPAAPPSAQAFDIWNKTALNRERLTSAVELYDRNGCLVSRFGLNFPEYSGSVQKPQARRTCDWDLFGETQPFDADERNMLHAERSICDPAGAVVGTVVVHVMLDYRNLPFISSQSPYFELFRPAASRAPGEGTAGNDVDVAIYGWGLHPIYSSSRTAWSIDDQTFARIYQPARAPFWAPIERVDGTYQVHFSNDRFFIYALGYPVVTLFEHLVHVAELTTMAGIAFVLVLLAGAVFTRVARDQPRVGRALLREIRASFYRKLFFAFVLAAVVPVLILAFVIRAYFADQLRDAVQSEAARTAAVAERVIHRWDALLRRSSEITSGSDDVMVSIGQIIEQDVNIFVGAELLATSERDLFSSGFLTTRTPDSVYRAIVLDRLPSFVADDQIATSPYLVAAAPVRINEQDAILTVPLANRRREIEREIDDLDRGVHLAVLCFVLLGAAIGLWLAERIADPVRRLTRATRRIAAGDFDAHIAMRSADELKRLVDSFNSMASELKAQRAQLERTHRLEAWAEMARQVAHEIKNPLTPIQLSAEHLRRVHADRGQPLGPVLESCVESILGQVRLLRQISSDFSSFAASPTARRAAADLPALVADVVDPYRTGLAGRIEIDNLVQPPLPQVVIDRTLIARALANLVENALHAMPGEGRLTLRARVRDQHVILEVIDTGLGIEPDALARVFEPYFSTKTTGTGLGLPIARRNVELSGGSIEVESTRGSGTTVRVTLPTTEL